MRSTAIVLVPVLAGLLVLSGAPAASAAAARPRIQITIGPVVTWDSFPEMDPGIGRGGSFGFMTDLAGLEMTVVQSFHDMHALPHTAPGKEAEYLLISIGTKICLLRHGPARPYASFGAALIDVNGHDALDTPGISGDVSLRGRALFFKVGVDLLTARWLALDAGATVRAVRDFESELGIDEEERIGDEIEGIRTGYALGLTLRLP